jgi:hypothetical protein
MAKFSSDCNNSQNNFGKTNCRAGKFYRLTLDALPVNIAILGAKGEIILVNKAW